MSFAKRRAFPLPGFEDLLRSMASAKPSHRPTALQAFWTLRRLLCALIFQGQLTIRELPASSPHTLSLHPANHTERSSPTTSSSRKESPPPTVSGSVEMLRSPQFALLPDPVFEETRSRRTAAPLSSAPSASQRAVGPRTNGTESCAAEARCKSATSSSIRIVSKGKETAQRLAAKQRLSCD